MYNGTRNVNSYFLFYLNIILYIFLELCRIHVATLPTPNFGSEACYCCCLCININ